MMRRLQGACQAQRSGAGLVFAAVVWPGLLAAEPVAVRYTEGSVHGFLVLRTLDDKLLADGDVTQKVTAIASRRDLCSISRTVRSWTRRPSTPSVSASG